MHPNVQWTTYKGDVLSRDRYIAGITGGLLIRNNTGGLLTWKSQRLEGTRVVVVGDTAVLTALVTDEVRRDGQDQSFTLRLTQTWVRAEGGWQCLAGHAGPVRRLNDLAMRKGASTAPPVSISADAPQRHVRK
jgi:hypothetical protein